MFDEKVYKVYDNAESRKPNLKVVQALLDESAELLVSKDKNLAILVMSELSCLKSLNKRVFYCHYRKPLYSLSLIHI